METIRYMLFIYCLCTLIWNSMFHLIAVNFIVLFMLHVAVTFLVILQKLLLVLLCENCQAFVLKSYYNSMWLMLNELCSLVMNNCQVKYYFILYSSTYFKQQCQLFTLKSCCFVKIIDENVVHCWLFLKQCRWVGVDFPEMAIESNFLSGYDTKRCWKRYILILKTINYLFVLFNLQLWKHEKLGEQI
jgi:hypothetical protein